jgi:D-sedoheptulose 7-phosphate isomerase
MRTAVPESLARAANEARLLLDRLAVEAGPLLERMAEACAGSIASGNKVLFVGNGGSAAQCQHLATELVCRFSTDRIPYAALALTTDTSFLTACANDYTFEEVFARQIEALGKAGDALVALSTSGRSPNLLRAVETAKSLGIPAFALSGGDGGPLARSADLAVVVPHGDPARIQEAHLFLGHLLCSAIEERVGGFDDHI